MVRSQQRWLITLKEIHPEFEKTPGSPSASLASFTDVAANADYAQAVAWAVEKGVAAGVGNNQFGPSQICSRGQIVSFLYWAFAK